MGYHLEAVARIVSCRVQQRLSTRSESFLASKAHYRLVISLGEEEKTEEKKQTSQLTCNCIKRTSKLADTSTSIMPRIATSSIIWSVPRETL